MRLVLLFTVIVLALGAMASSAGRRPPAGTAPLSLAGKWRGKEV